MSKLLIAGGRKFVPHAEPNERIDVNEFPVKDRPTTSHNGVINIITKSAVDTQGHVKGRT